MGVEVMPTEEGGPGQHSLRALEKVGWKEQHLVGPQVLGEFAV